MSRIIRTLVAAGAALGLSAFGLMAAHTASATNSPGTTGPGSWSFDPGTGSNAIQTITGKGPLQYQAQVQQPINPNATSVWSAKKCVIPVQFYLQQRSCTQSDTTYPGSMSSGPGWLVGVNPYTNLQLTPAGNFTLSQLTSLEADYGWTGLSTATDEGGSLRWQIDLANGKNINIYYGDYPNFTSESAGNGSGVNLLSLIDARVDTTQLGGQFYDTWANAVASYGPDQVSSVALIVDSGAWMQNAQQLQLTDANVTIGGESDGYIPGDVSTLNCGSWQNTTSPPMYIDVVQGSISDPGVVDETTYTGVGDTGGQFAVVNGMYKYNLSNQMNAGTYNIFMTPDTDADRIPVSNSPTGAATFVLK